MRRGARAYVFANVVSQIFSLVRFALLARLLGPYELGLAAMLMLTSQFFISISDTGSDRFVVQDRDGDDPKMMGVIHLISAGRGALLAVALLSLAGLVSRYFGAPEIYFPLMFLALSPLIGGFLNLDYRRVQREFDFRAESSLVIVAETASLIATVVAAWIVRDASAIVWGMCVRSAAMVLVSHVIAKRPYRWAFNTNNGLRFSKFAMPLLLNGILLFFGSQGDRAVIADIMDPDTLGRYSAILLLILAPTAILSRLFTGFSLPSLVAAREAVGGVREEAERLGGRLALISNAIVAGFCLVAPFATPLLYGAAFRESLSLYGAIAALQTARFLRVWPSIIATSIGRSDIILANNIVRMVGIAVAIFTGYQTRSPQLIVLAFFLGELLALTAALVQLHAVGALNFKREAVRVSAFLLFASSAISWTWAIGSDSPVAVWIAALTSVGALAGLTTERRAIGESLSLGLRLWSRRG
jgi:O-antigen/teichoic acid export membrane protein